jgi:hypothetical protein
MSRRRKFQRDNRTTGVVVGTSPNLARRHREKFATNGRARAKVLFWAIAVSFAYGVLNNVILGRPEDRVDLEMLLVCASTVLLQIGMYYTGSKYFQTGRALMSGLWGRISRFEHWAYAPAMTALVFAISLSCMMFIGAPKFQAKVIDFRLDRLTKQILTVEAASPSQERVKPPFEQLLSAVKTTAALNIPVDTKRVERARNAIAESLSSKEFPESVMVSGWETMAGLGAYADYRSIQQGGQVLRPVWLGKADPNETFVLSSSVQLKDMPAWFVGTQSNVLIGDVGFILTNGRAIFDNIRFEGEYNGAVPILVEDAGSKVLVRNSTFKSVTQDLQNISWENDQFRDSVIRYSGGPVNLYMVKFQQCKFQFGDDSTSRELEIRIQNANGQAVSFSAGGPK